MYIQIFLFFHLYLFGVRHAAPKYDCDFLCSRVASVAPHLNCCSREDA